jgi:O-antigen ligase
VLVVGGVLALSNTSIGGSHFAQQADSSASSRQEMFKTTVRAAKDFAPFGSGLGSFQRVYQLYEDPAEVTNTYVIHAHNDYAEIALELGIPGILLVLAFLLWWAVAVWRVWRSAEAGPFVRAASIASAVVLVHSLVEFPLRTAALSACFAFCAALLADRRAPQKIEAADLRPTRHVVFR